MFEKCNFQSALWETEIKLVKYNGNFYQPWGISPKLKVFFAKLKEFFAKLKEFFAKLNFSAICGTQGGGKALKKQAC